MTTGLNPAPVSVVGPIMAGAMGFDWATQREEVVLYLNKYRELLYNGYGTFKLFDDLFYCFCATEFQERCDVDCQGESRTYRGFTLPHDVAAVAAAWESGYPLTARSRWRETLTGRVPSGPVTEVFEMAEQFATERDPDGLVPLKMFAASAEDAGKEVRVVVRDADWQEKELVFKLAGDSWVSVGTLVREIRSVSLPTGRCGMVTIAQQDGYELSKYAPAEIAPNYRRFKIADGCSTVSVLIQGVRRYTDVFDDHDLVEVGSRLVIEAAGRFFKYGENTVDEKEIKRAGVDLSTMNGYLDGLIARHRGSAKQDGSPYRGRPFPRHKKHLPGYRS